MKKTKFTEAYYNWKKKYGGLGVPELRRLKQLEEEIQHLKQLVANLSLDKQMLILAASTWLFTSASRSRAKT